VSHTKGVHNGRDAKPAKAERAETRNPRRQRATAETRNPRRQRHALRAKEATRCVQKEPRKATCYVQRRSRDGHARQEVLTGYMRRREPCGRHRDDRGTCKEHMSHAAPDKCREKAEAENELNRASEAIEHEVNTHCMVHPNAENRGVCLGGGVCGCGVHSRSVGLCRPLIGELPVGRPATVQ
jgi:hypothetical protein